MFWLVAALGAQLRLTANMLDGMVALASGRDSKVGELYNEVPDRVSDAAVFIGAGYAWGGNVALGYIATILAIFTAYVRAAGKIAGAPNEFRGPNGQTTPDAGDYRCLLVFGGRSANMADFPSG